MSKKTEWLVMESGDCYNIAIVRKITPNGNGGSILIYPDGSKVEVGRITPENIIKYLEGNGLNVSKPPVKTLDPAFSLEEINQAQDQINGSKQ